MKTLFTIIAIALSGVLAASPALAEKAKKAAPAPAPTYIAVISQELALAKSKVGAYVAEKLKELDKQIDTEFEPELAPLRTQAQQLNAEASALSPETLSTRTDLQRRGQEIRMKLAELGDWKKRQMEATREQALKPVLKAYEMAVNAVIKERGIQILLPGQATLYRTSSVDITQDVVNKIDAAMTTTPVNRVRVPRKPQPRQQGQAPAR